ncbi:hypothetical protein F4604DRAFT_2042302 [Suillus subluteus]|nr:hypothetical protein F4604DRAFT_2042302 [Suillus subluteus]
MIPSIRGCNTWELVFGHIATRLGPWWYGTSNILLVIVTGKVVQSSPILPTSAHLKYNIDAVKHYIVNTSDPHLIAYVLLMSTNGAEVDGLKYVRGDPIYFVRGLWHFTVSDVRCDHLNPHVTVVFDGVSLSVGMGDLFDGHTLNLKLILIAVSFISFLQLMVICCLLLHPQATEFSSDEDFADEHAKSLMPKRCR